MYSFLSQPIEHTDHRLVDRIAGQVARGAPERLWPWVETAEVSRVKFQNGCFIVWMVEIASRLIALQGVIDGWRQRRLQARGFGNKLGNVGRGAGQHQTDHTGWMREHIWRANRPRTAPTGESAPG